MPNVGPTTTFRFTAPPSSRRYYGQKFEWRAHREPLTPKEQPTISNEDGTKTLRVRTNVDGGQSALPLPPLMDPIAIAAKQKFRPPKPYRRGSGRKTEFQKALAVNPFARALATPVRKCNYTQARLPSHFLQPLTAEFRIKDGRLRGYVGSDQPSSEQKEDTLEDEAKGSYAGTAKSKGYIVNSQPLFQMLGRKLQRKKNWGSVVTERMREAYLARAKALSAQKGTKLKLDEDWTWMGSDETTQRILVDDAVRAFEEYLDREPEHEDLLPIEELKKIPFDLISHPSAWGASNDNDSDMVRIDPAILQENGGDVLLPVYDFSNLRLVERLVAGKLKDTGLGSHLEDSPVLGILQSRRTLKLHLALHKLVLYLGEMGQRGMCQWILISDVDWQLRKSNENTYLLGDAMGAQSLVIGEVVGVEDPSVDEDGGDDDGGVDVANDPEGDL